MSNQASDVDLRVKMLLRDAQEKLDTCSQLLDAQRPINYELQLCVLAAYNRTAAALRTIQLQAEAKEALDALNR